MMPVSIRTIPVLKRLVPSIKKRLARLKPKREMPGCIKLSGLPSPILHIFGDSHVGLFKTLAGMDIHYLGPITMHRVGRDGIEIFSFNKLAIKPGEALGFVFGEIDVRVHVAKQGERGRKPDEIIATLAANFLATLEKAKQLFPSSPIILFSVVPPASLKHPNFDPQYPRNGSDQDRAAWTRQLNLALKQGAQRRGFGFVDQYTPFADRNGLLDLNISADGVHINAALPQDVELVCV